MAELTPCPIGGTGLPASPNKTILPPTNDEQVLAFPVGIHSLLEKSAIDCSETYCSIFGFNIVRYSLALSTLENTISPIKPI